MNAKKILWATEFSNMAENALPFIESLSKEENAEIHVLYVEDDIAHHEPWYGVFTRRHAARIEEWENKFAAKRLDQVCDKYMGGCPTFIKHIAVGNPADEILKMVEKENMDMVVMASHTHTGTAAYESTPEKVMNLSPVPVKLIPVD